MANKLIVEKRYTCGNVDTEFASCVTIYPEAFAICDLESIRIESIDNQYNPIINVGNIKHMLNTHFSSNPAIIMPTKIIFNGPATIVFWNDGDKTVVKQSESDIYDYEKGFAMCVVKKVFGVNYSKVRKMCDKAHGKHIQKSIGKIENKSIAEQFARIFGKREY